MEVAGTSFGGGGCLFAWALHHGLWEVGFVLLFCRYCAELRAGIEDHCDSGVTCCNPRRLTEANGFTMHEAQEGQAGGGQCKARGVGELAIENERGDRAEHQSTNNRTTTQDAEP